MSGLILILGLLFVLLYVPGTVAVFFQRNSKEIPAISQLYLHRLELSIA